MQDQSGAVQTQIRVQFHVPTSEVGAPLLVIASGRRRETDPELLCVGPSPGLFSSTKGTSSPKVELTDAQFSGSSMHYSADLRHKRHSVVEPWISAKEGSEDRSDRSVQASPGCGFAPLQALPGSGCTVELLSHGASVPIIPSHARSRLVVEYPTKQFTP